MMVVDCKRIYQYEFGGVSLPELPEVETIVRGLRSVIIGRRISDISINKPKMWQGMPTTQIIGKKVLSIDRVAKLLVFKLSDDLSLLIHLKMTGQLIFVDDHGKSIAGGHPDNQFLVEQPSKYTHIIFDFEDGSHLFFNDMRQFGYCKLISYRTLIYKNLVDNVGVDPLKVDFTVIYLLDQLQRRPKSTVKQVLLDQSAIGGIGNIYADESLFDAKLLPARKAASISHDEAKALQQSIIKILKKGIQYGGTSFKDYVHHTGKKGTMQEHLMVYGRAGKECKVCGSIISRTVIGGRGTHFCPGCQK